jgi:cell division septation protein DedD
MRFQPHQTKSWVEANGRIVWTSETKRLAGIEFSDLPDEGRQVLRESLSEPSWRLVSNRGIDGAELRAANQPSVIATTHSEVMRTDSTSKRPFDNGTVVLFRSSVPDVTRQALPARIFKTAVVLAILCVLVAGIIGVFRPNMASRVFGTIHNFVSGKGAAARPTEGVRVLPPAVPIQREPESSVSSMSSKPSPPLPSPSPRDLPGTVLQIAAMAHVENANALDESLQRNNFPAFVSRRSADRFYKVLVGPYDDPHSVDIVKEKLTMQGIKAIETRWLP